MELEIMWEAVYFCGMSQPRINNPVSTADSFASQDSSRTTTKDRK